MTPLEVYIWLKLSDINAVCICVCIFSFIGLALAKFIEIIAFNDKDVEKSKSLSKLLLPVSICTLLLGTLLPDSKQFAAIKVLPAIYESKAIQKDLPELYDVAVEFLKENLKPKPEGGK